MPNIIIETSHPDLISKPANLLARINDRLWQSGEFGKPEDIKTRLYTPANALIGLATGTSHEFIYVHFYLMQGRDDMIKQALVKRIADAITEHINEFEKREADGSLQICVNPMELNDNYMKKSI